MKGLLGMKSGAFPAGGSRSQVALLHIRLSRNNVQPSHLHRNTMGR